MVRGEIEKYHISLKSKNRKTGNIVTVTSSRDTCPDSCPFKLNGCYANGGPLRTHWNRINNSGINFKELINVLSGVKSRIRLWQAGDMPGINNKIDFKKIKQLVIACKGAKAFGYTHKPLTINNIKAIQYCNDNGVTINLSANNLAHADDLFDLGIGPVVVTLGKSSRKKDIYTSKGRFVLVCPAKEGKLMCSNCGGSKGALCYRVDRDYIIGFVAHGNAANRVSKIAQGYELY